MVKIPIPRLQPYYSTGIFEKQGWFCGFPCVTLGQHEQNRKYAGLWSGGGEKGSVMAELKQSERTCEEAYLEKTIRAAKGQLEKVRETMDQKQAEMIAVKKEILENTDHRPGNLWGSEGFEALVELSQEAAPAAELAADQEALARKAEGLERLIRSPYFARIDFRFEDEEEAEEIYIGRTSLMEGGGGAIYVYDWRSPIASVFYRFMTGEAYYDAPGGRIDGEVTGKRQYEIRDGKLIYFFDTDRNISDEILRQMLSKNASPVMKSIVETIQREQDLVIRSMEHDLLMIQGVAGSGKTSIALHRAAYLLYQGLQNRLRADNILIVSPNAAFEQYISQVLPELGEEQVVSVVFEDLLREALGDRSFQSRAAFLESVITNGKRKNLEKRSMKFKGSRMMKRILDQFLEDIPRYEIDYRDIWFQGTLAASGEEMKSRVLRRPELSLGARMEQLENWILERVSEKWKIGGEEKNQILQELWAFTRLNPVRLYRRLWEQAAYFEAAFLDGDPGDRGIMSAEDMEQIRRDTVRSLRDGRLSFADATAVLYLHEKIYGSRRYQNIRQVIIDEAQDYEPLQYEIFHMLFPGAKYTILGDVNQTLGKQEDMTFYQRLPELLGRKNSGLITLDKSFRCTNEILQFGLSFISHRPELESFNRSGAPVKAEAFGDRKDYLEAICREVVECREAGLETVCLMGKTEESCRRLYGELKSRMKVRLAGSGETGQLRGNFVIPSYLTKGLEFDAVILCDADRQSYCDEDDRKLLYVASTRALHRLSLFCHGEMTGLVTC